MPYLVLILFPVAMAAGCFLLRKQTRLVVVTGAITLATLLGVALVLPIDQPARLLGLTLIVSGLGRLFLLTFLGVGTIAVLAAVWLSHGEHYVPVMLLVFGLVNAIIMLQDPFLITLLLVAAGVVLVLAVVDLPAGAAALVPAPVLAGTLKYLVLMVIAGVLLYLGFVLAVLARAGDVPDRLSPARLILALLSVGFALRLAIIPFHSWLPDLVEQAAPLVSAVTVAVINMVSLQVMIVSFQRFPVLTADAPRALDVLLVAGAGTALLGALLALGQTGLRRFVAYLLVYNAGMIMFGVASLREAGLAGAVFEAFNQALVSLLIFLALGMLEQNELRQGGSASTDLLRRWPVAGSAFLFGMLGLLGMPLLSGFAAKLQIYTAAYQRGWPYLVVLVAATLLGMLALGRVTTTHLLGPGEPDAPEEPAMLGTTELDRPTRRRRIGEARGPALLATMLAGASLAIGLYPQPVVTAIQQVIRGLAFVRAL